MRHRVPKHHAEQGQREPLRSQGARLDPGRGVTTLTIVPAADISPASRRVAREPGQAAHLSSMDLPTGESTIAIAVTKVSHADQPCVEIARFHAASLEPSDHMALCHRRLVIHRFFMCGCHATLRVQSRFHLISDVSRSRPGVAMPTNAPFTHSRADWTAT